MATLSTPQLEALSAKIQSAFSAARIQFGSGVHTDKLLSTLTTIDAQADLMEAAVIAALPNPSDERTWLVANQGLARRIAAAIFDARRENL